MCVKMDVSPYFSVQFYVDIVEVTDSSSVSPTPKNPAKPSVLRGFFVSGPHLFRAHEGLHG